MVAPSKIFTIFLSAVVYYFSISSSIGYFLQDSEIGISGNYNLLDYWNPQPSNLFFLIEPVKTHLQTDKDFSVFSLKNFVNNLKTLWEFANNNTTTDTYTYICLSKAISFRLEIRVIIFPFHYFW